jgi:hypothetical protein
MASRSLFFVRVVTKEAGALVAYEERLSGCVILITEPPDALWQLGS